MYKITNNNLINFVMIIQLKRPSINFMEALFMSFSNLEVKRERDYYASLEFTPKLVKGEIS